MILVTGASGFVGRALVERLATQGPLRAALWRRAVNDLPAGVEVAEGDLSLDTNWSNAVAGVSAVIHCAARVHVMNEEASDPLAEFRRVNVDGTLRLAAQSAASGVRRFVFVSSIKVNGEQTRQGTSFVADQAPNPVDPYGISKMEAEEGLRTLAQESGMEVVIIRPPLVYGPGVKANFLAMMRCLKRGIPLPLGAVVANRRSFVYLDNLVDLIVTCLEHPKAANQTFLVSDGEDLSTADLLQRMGQALGKPAWLIPVPQQLLAFGAKALGKPGIAQRLCGSLQVNITKTRETLGWSPPVSVDEGLRQTVAHWLATRS